MKRKLLLNESLFEGTPPLTPKQRKQVVNPQTLRDIMNQIKDGYSAVASEYTYPDSRFNTDTPDELDMYMIDGWRINRYSANGVVVEMGLMRYDYTGNGNTVRRVKWKRYADHTPEERSRLFGYIEPEDYENDKDNAYYRYTGKYYWDGEDISHREFKSMRNDMTQNITQSVLDVVPEASVEVGTGKMSVTAYITIPYEVFMK